MESTSMNCRGTCGCHWAGGSCADR